MAPARVALTHAMPDQRLVSQVVRLSPSGDRSFLIRLGEILTNSATARDGADEVLVYSLLYLFTGVY
jgi:hypothetical protein